MPLFSIVPSRELRRRTVCAFQEDRIHSVTKADTGSVSPDPRCPGIALSGSPRNLSEGMT